MSFDEKGLKIGHVNTRSWLKKMDETFHVLKGVDILGISETWLNDTHTDGQVCRDGYGIVHGDRNVTRIDNRGNKKGGGLIFYIKHEFFCHTSELSEITSSTSDLEQLWVDIQKQEVRDL